MSAARLRLLLWTLRYIQPAQMVTRGRRIIRRRVERVLRRRPAHPTDWKLADTTPLWMAFEATDFAPFREPPLGVESDAAIARATGMAQGEFDFLHHRANLAAHGLGHDGWHDPQLSHLWRYHLHYFHYVRDLLVWARSGHAAEAYAAFRALAGGWIAHNDFFGGDGWHPYTLSLRTVNWLHAIAGFKAELGADPEFRARLIGSLYGQIQRLASDLETDVRGNHLMENLRALAWAGVAFEGEEPQRWFATALRLLESEVREQVLPDGGHFERAPGYHLVILKDLLEIAIWWERNGRTVPEWLRSSVTRMADYVVAILPPDRQMPLLKDTAWDAAPPAHELLAAVALWLDAPRFKRHAALTLYPFLLFGADGLRRWQAMPLSDEAVPSRALNDSGHFVARDDSKGDYLIFDAGKVCPDYLPSHAHADLLTYELYAAGQRVIVDSGIYEYTNGPWRDYFRSTRAHNTVEIAGQNQSEVWGSFRVARRARPRDVWWQDQGDTIIMQASHDGYERLATPARHRRTLVWRRGAFWLVCDEIVWLQTPTTLPPVVDYVHFDPTLTPVADNTGWRIPVPQTPLWLTPFGMAGHDMVRGQTEPVRQGWYSCEFGSRVANAVLGLRPTDDALRAGWFGYILSRDAPATMTLVDGHLKIAHGAGAWTLRVPRAGKPELTSLAA